MIKPSHAAFAILCMLGACSEAAVEPMPELTGPMGAHGEAALADMEMLLDVVRTDYAGWPTKSTGPLAAEIREAERRMRETARKADTATDHFFALYDYVESFDDGHLSLSPQVAVTWPPFAQQTVPGDLSESDAEAAGLMDIEQTTVEPISRTAFESRLDALGDDRKPIEAVWSIEGDRYVIGVIRRDDRAEQFDALILSTTAETWRSGETKAAFAPDGSGRFVSRYLAGDRSASVVSARLRHDAQILDMSRWGRWSQLYPMLADPELERRATPPHDFSLETLPDGTPWLRLPNFSLDNAQRVQDLIEENRTLLESSDYFVVDVRNNGGGGDATYEPILPFLLPGDFSAVGVELRTTPRNIAALRAVVEEVRQADAEQARSIAELLDDVERRADMDGDGDGFTSLFPEAEVVQSVDPAPGSRRVAVLIDGAGSSGEQFVLDVQDAPGVVTFGFGNTAGVLDYSNVVSETLPSGIAVLNWPTTRSLRLPENPVDDGGISPDVRFDESVDDPVMAALDWLKTNP